MANALKAPSFYSIFQRSMSQNDIRMTQNDIRVTHDDIRVTHSDIIAD